jgi:hypothetical protein
MVEIKAANDWNVHFGYPIQTWKLVSITKTAHVTREKFLRVLDKMKVIPRVRSTPVVEPTTPVVEPATPVVEPATPVVEPTTPVVEPIPCRENCGKRYRHQSGEARHYREYHLKKPRTCREEILESVTSFKERLDATEKDLTKALEKVKQLETVIERLRVSRQRRVSKKFVPTMSGEHL